MNTPTLAPLSNYRPAAYDGADREADFNDGDVLPSPEFTRVRAVVKVALRALVLGRGDSQALAQVRKHIAGLDLPAYRLVRLKDLTAHEVWPADRQPAGLRMRGEACTHGQWRQAAYLAHRAALALLLDVPPQSYADVRDQLDMLFETSSEALQAKQRRALLARMEWHVARMIAGVPFQPRPPHSKKVTV